MLGEALAKTGARRVQIIVYFKNMVGEEVDLTDSRRS